MTSAGYGGPQRTWANSPVFFFNFSLLNYFGTSPTRRRRRVLLRDGREAQSELLGHGDEPRRLRVREQRHGRALAAAPPRAPREVGVARLGGPYHLVIALRERRAARGQRGRAARRVGRRAAQPETTSSV